MEVSDWDAIGLLRDFVGPYRTNKLAAQALKISAQHLSDMLNGKRNVSDPVLERLGYKREVRIVKRIA